MKSHTFLIGTTSFVFHADILTNVDKLAPFMDDVELVIFVTDKDNNLPSHSVLINIAESAEKNNMGYTVHLPLRLSLGDDNAGLRIVSVKQAVTIINLMKPVTPRAYIIHLNAAKTCKMNTEKAWQKWIDDCCASIIDIISQTGFKDRLCIENLEGYDITRLYPVLDTAGVNLCLDIGHLWVQGKNPVRYIDHCAERIRVVHLHGINKRDHSSLAHADKRELKKVLDALIANHFSGVLTLEVFSFDDLLTSLEVLDSLKVIKSLKAVDFLKNQESFRVFEF